MNCHHREKALRTTACGRAVLCLLLLAVFFQVNNGQQQEVDQQTVQPQEQQPQPTTPTNDTGLLSDLWTSLTTVGKTASCPGECLHAITSIFCDHVLEEISCGENYLRCCVSGSPHQSVSAASYGSASSGSGETAPPEYLSTYTSTEPPPTVAMTVETFSVISNNHNHSSGGGQQQSTVMGSSSATITTTQPSAGPDLILHTTTEPVPPPVNSGADQTSNIPTTTNSPALDLLNLANSLLNESGRDSSSFSITGSSNSCPVECTRFSSAGATFCVKALRGPGVCNNPEEEECCLEREPAEGGSQVDQLTKNLIKLVQQSVALNETKNIGSELAQSFGSNSAVTSSPPPFPPPTTQSSLPSCDGTCVISLFSLLCDEVDAGQFCPNGGSCCVNREPTTSATPVIGPCDGNCIPVVLSGMCNKPFELVLKTSDCASGTICCADRKGGEGGAGSSEQTSSSSSQEDIKGTDGLLSGDDMIGPAHGMQPPYANRVPIRPPMHPGGQQFFPPPGLHLQYTTNNNNNGNGQHLNGFIPKPNSGGMPIPPMQPIPPKANKHRKPTSPQQQAPPVGIGEQVVHFPGDTSQSLPENAFIGPEQQQPQQSTNPHHFILPHVIDPNSFDPLAASAAAEPETKPAVVVSHKKKPVQPLFPCPGNCLAPMFRFACLGGNSIYPKFHCSKGQLCCAPSGEIDKLEAFLAAANTGGGPPAMVKPIQIHAHPHPHPAPPPPQQPEQPLKPLFPAPIPDSTIIISNDYDSQHSMPHICGVKGVKQQGGGRGRRVVGADSYPGEWCWQVALMNQKNNYICGGALIGRQWVLTAAHCLTAFIRKNEPIFVRAGEYDLKRSNKLGIKVATSYVHHNHNGQTLDNDIALLKLSSPVELNAETCLVCLPTTRSSSADRGLAGKRCTVTGYGFQHESGPVALRVRQASVPVVEDQECSARINNVTERLFILPVSSFCAGGELGNDACTGDGGSGLVCQSEGFYELTGLVSWGFGCGRNGVPGVYAKVSSFVGWINQIVSTNSN